MAVWFQSEAMRQAITHRRERELRMRRRRAAEAAQQRAMEEAGASAPAAAPEPAAEEPQGATCPACGKGFKTKHIPHFHARSCGKG